MTTATRTRSAAPDGVLADAVDIARAAAVEEDGELGRHVGDHVGVDREGERAATHRFACLNPGYRGWCWAVSVSRAPRSRQVTVDEVVLLPGEEALLPPAWVPWSERLRPGDLGVGDLLPTSPDDDRLAPAYSAVDDDEEVEEAGAEIGLGRVRVLSLVGLQEAADRWYAGDGGPGSALAKAAPAACGTCGFYLPLSGSMRRAFGVCANEFAPDDGRVVAADHGCGAHSEVVDVPSFTRDPPPALVDDYAYDLVPLLPLLPVHAPGSVDDLPAADEPFGHS